MEIAKDRVVSFDYTLTLADGQVVDSSKGKQPLAYLHGKGQIIPGLEANLVGKQKGDQVNVTIPPEQAYGQRNPQLIQVAPKAAFQGAPQLVPGMQFQGNTPQGPRMVRIVKVEGDNVTIDANHPLAGQTLNFDVTIVDVRDATPEELTHGHAHGPGGHNH